MTDLINKLPGAFTRSEAADRGISKTQLYAWRDDGTLTTIARGIFMKSHTVGDPDLVELAVRSRDVTLCLSSALAHHGLSDEIPDTIHAAVPRGTRHPRTTAPVTWHTFDAATFAIGRTSLTVIEGRSLGIYGAARSIIDAFRLRHLQGQDLAIEALRRWLRQRTTHTRELLDLLPNFPAADKPIRAALEVLL